MLFLQTVYYIVILSYIKGYIDNRKVIVCELYSCNTFLHFLRMVFNDRKENWGGN